MLDADKLRLFEAEYFKLQDIVETFDERTLQIKGWSVTVSLAAIISAYASEAAKGHEFVIIYVAAMSALSFWIIEFFWKCFQWTLILRVDEIEAFMRGEAACTLPLQIRSSWTRNFKAEVKRSVLAAKFLKPSLALPHALIMFLAVVLAGSVPS
jgi:hypothetical protein